MTALCRDCFWTGAEEPRRCPSCQSLRLVRHAELAQLSIAHLDCDAFYASVEKRDDPSLRDEPLIVGGGVRGVVTTCCYIARMSGVRSAMPMFRARKLCPEAVVVPPNFAKYRAESGRIMAKLRQITPLVQPLSLDEAWLDLSGTERLHGATPAETLARLQAEIERDIGITVSVGLAANKFLAKIASDLDKPRGFAVIGAAEAKDFLARRPVSILPGVGPAFAQTLQSDGYATVGDLAEAEPKRLADRYGAHGLHLHQLAHGRDSRRVNPRERRKSMSAETTFDTDISDVSALEDILWPLCEKVARHARGEAIAGRVVTLKLRQADFRIVTRRRTLPFPTQTARTLFAAAREMLGVEARGRPWRLIGVGISDIVEQAAAGGDFFDGGESRALSGEKAIDALRGRFGAQAVIMGRTLKR
ncbi:MAG TPA: DNA polymerase IV [Caulobacteraceae bacterium]|nr:DNA polymerase IV [Caulobacteraceae bacterium]